MNLWVVPLLEGTSPYQNASSLPSNGKRNRPRFSTTQIRSLKHIWPFRRDNSSAIINKAFSIQIVSYNIGDNITIGIVASKLFAFGPRKTVQGVFAILERIVVITSALAADLGPIDGETGFESSQVMMHRGTQRENEIFWADWHHLTLLRMRMPSSFYRRLIGRY
jgi:hypothetical protein